MIIFRRIHYSNLKKDGKKHKLNDATYFVKSFFNNICCTNRYRNRIVAIYVHKISNSRQRAQKTHRKNIRLCCNAWTTAKCVHLSLFLCVWIIRVTFYVSFIPFSLSKGINKRHIFPAEFRLLFFSRLNVSKYRKCRRMK